MSLSNQRILEHMQEKNIVIKPYNEQDLCTSSYDVRLGPWFYREQKPKLHRGRRKHVFNPYNEEDVHRVWGKPQEAKTLGQQISTMYGFKSPMNSNIDLYDENKEHISLDDHVIFIEPGETILGHTMEFIGGINCITTSMQARSSQGRSFIGVCKCAGWGDVGYINRWTMEITNFAKYHTIPLVIGRRYAQISFWETGDILKEGYGESGKYQIGSSIEEIEKSWKPEMMLPKLYVDRDIKK